MDLSPPCQHAAFLYRLHVAVMCSQAVGVTGNACESVDIERAKWPSQQVWCSQRLTAGHAVDLPVFLAGFGC